MTHGRKPRQKGTRKGLKNRWSERDQLRNVRKIASKHEQRRAPKDEPPPT